MKRDLDLLRDVVIGFIWNAFTIGDANITVHLNMDGTKNLSQLSQAIVHYHSLSVMVRYTRRESCKDLAL